MASSGSQFSGHARRIMAFDGGGIRGLISLGIAEQIESHLRQARSRPDLVLADEFDLFAGTSTGAVIASCLAWGMPVADIVKLYLEQATLMFTPSSLWQRLKARYRSETLEKAFRSTFTEADGSPATFASRRFRSLVIIVLRNASTGSVWPLCNNPAAAFNRADDPECNLHIPVWKLLRATTAAPTFFSPECIPIGKSNHAFIDGGITPYNNPALIALLMATLPEYRMGWESGPDRLKVLSIGTGLARVTIGRKAPASLHLFDHLKYMPAALIESITEHEDLICRILGSCITGDPIDREVGDLKNSGVLPNESRLCAYGRFNPPLPQRIPMDSIRHMHDCLAIGRAASIDGLSALLDGP